MSAPTPSHDQGEFAVRGGLVDLFPSGEEQALRLDFFGDEIESVRTFDPADQRTTGRIDGFTLLPASEALLDEESIKRFRSALSRDVRRDRDRRSALPGDQRRPPARRHGALAAAVRGAAGDAVRPSRPTTTLIVRDAGVDGAAEQRFEAIADYHANRVKRAVERPGQLSPARRPTRCI